MVAAAFCERASLWAFARMQLRLLRAAGHHLAAISAGAITFAANALSRTVPLAGPGLATAYTYREWGRRRVGRPAAAFALAVSGVLSTVSLLVILAVGALASGNRVGEAACLALSIKAVGLPVPLRDLLLVWSAGLAASTINLTPGGAGRASWRQRSSPPWSAPGRPSPGPSSPS